MYEFYEHVIPTDLQDLFTFTGFIRSQGNQGKSGKTELGPGKSGKIVCF